MSEPLFNEQAVFQHVRRFRVGWVGLPTIYRAYVDALGDSTVFPNEADAVELRAVLDELVRRGLLSKDSRDPVWRVER